MISYIDQKIQDIAQAFIDETDIGQRKICNALISVASICGIAYASILFSEAGINSENFLKILSALLLPVLMIVASYFLPLRIIDLTRAFRVCILFLCIVQLFTLDSAKELIDISVDICVAAFYYFASCDKPKPKKRTRLATQ